MDKLTNCEIACRYLGWQGGTIHQVSETTGLTLQEILDSPDIVADIDKRRKDNVLIEENKKLRRLFYLRDVYGTSSRGHLFDSVEYYRLKKELKING